MPNPPSSDHSGVTLDRDQVSALIATHFPQIHGGGQSLFIDSVGPCTASVRLAISDRNVRPGGTVSGPTMFSLADFSIYVAILATLGEGAIQAVTSNLNINFLTRPEPKDMTADVRLIRIGRRQVVAEVALRTVGQQDMVAHAVATYALPGKR